tara:strand:- start:334 stop:546 length:213 start_codon:yes stop_codon:yes gene_type:complete
MLDGNIAVSTAFMITMGSAIITYFWGRYSLQQSIEKTAEDLISILEKDGYVKCNTDEYGDKILVKIDEIK